MREQWVGELGTQCVFLGGYVVVGLLIVLVMRRKAPVWGGRAAKASLLALIPGFFIFQPQAGRETHYATPVASAALLGMMALIVIVTGAGSRLSRLPASGQVRQATLEPRRLFVARVPHQRVAAVVTAAITFAVCIAGGLTATDGSKLERRHGSAVGTAYLYPGWPAAVPVMAMGALLLASTWWALREIEARPRISEPTDTLLRARDASRVLRATTFGFALSVFSLLVAIASRMNEATQKLRVATEAAPHSPGDLYQWVAFGLWAPAIVLLLVAVFAIGGSVGSRNELAELGVDTGDAYASTSAPTTARP